MSRHEPDQIREAIWALMGEHSGAKIAAMLAADEVGLGRSVPMSKRTVERRIAELRKERGDPPRTVEPGHEVEAAQTIHRTFLSLVMLELKEVATSVDKRKRLRELGPSVRIIIDAAKPASQAGQAGSGRRGGKAPARTPKSKLDEIGKEISREAALPSSGSEESATQRETGQNGTSNETTKDTTESNGAGNVHADTNTPSSLAEPSPLHSSG